ncbi:MAG: UDP-3-O-(3-hydroxymyristoyl)glucosamine N-acyltransferase [Candidatus Hinthialibacter sp.]
MNRVAATTNMASTALKTIKQDEKGFIHPSAIIDPSVQLGEGVIIHANVVIERGVRIDGGTVIHVGCYIGEDCILGEDAVLMPSVTLREKTQVGARVKIGAGVVIGSDGFGYAKQENGVNFKVPQVGYVVIENDVCIGANTTIDRATLGQTIISQGAQIGNLVQVGHNVHVGAESEIGDNVGICGSCKIGSQVHIGQGVGMVGHIRIGNKAHVAGGSGISKDVPDGIKMKGIPAMDEDSYSQYSLYLQRLSELVARVKALEKRVCQDSEETSI